MGRLAGRSYLFYLLKLILPRALSPFYPYQKGKGVSLSMIASVVLVVLEIILCGIAWRRGKRIWLVAWACYVVMLLPMIGLIQIGDQAAADRYAYLTSFPLLLIFSSGLAYTGIFFSASRRSFFGRSSLIALSSMTVSLAERGEDGPGAGTVMGQIGIKDVGPMMGVRSSFTTPPQARPRCLPSTGGCRPIPSGSTPAPGLPRRYPRALTISVLSNGSRENRSVRRRRETISL